jgi:F-box/WD-40 domain protein MET30
MKPYHDSSGEHVRRVVTASLDHTLKIWDYNTGELVRTLFGHTDGVWCVDVDSIRIVSGSKDGTIKVWDIETGQCIYTIESHNGAVFAVSLSDTKLISADLNGVVTVRDFLNV